MHTPTDAHTISIDSYDVLAALIEVHNRDGRCTVRSVARQALKSTATTHYHLVKLRLLGLVRWDPGVTGSLRPAVQIVATDL